MSIDETKTSFRERKLDPKKCDPKTYRSKKIKPGVTATFCKTKEDVRKKGEKKSKMKLQTIIRSKRYYKKSKTGKITRRKKPLPKKSTKRKKTGKGKRTNKPKKKTKK